MGFLKSRKKFRNQISAPAFNSIFLTRNNFKLFRAEKILLPKNNLRPCGREKDEKAIFRKFVYLPKIYQNPNDAEKHLSDHFLHPKSQKSKFHLPRLTFFLPDVIRAIEKSAGGCRAADFR